MICKRCGTVFCDDYADERDGVKLYCSKLCKHRAKPAYRKRQRAEKQSGKRMVPCPAPRKRRYGNLAEAAAEAARITGKTADGKPLHPYPCQCGWWHVTSRRIKPHDNLARLAAIDEGRRLA